jgi:hypothetical protein
VYPITDDDDDDDDNGCSDGADGENDAMASFLGGSKVFITRFRSK